MTATARASRRMSLVSPKRYLRNHLVPSLPRGEKGQMLSTTCLLHFEYLCACGAFTLAWIVRGSSSSKWAYKKEPQLPSSKAEQQQRPKSPSAAANRRRAPTSGKAPRHSVNSEAPRSCLPSATEEWQGSGGIRNYLGQGTPVQSNGACLSKGLPFSPIGVTFPPQSSGIFSAWPQGPVVEGLAGDFQVDDTCGQQLRAISERLSPLGGGPQGLGAAETAPNRPGELRLPMMPCRGVFTTADSPMSQRPSPKEKLACTHDGSTGYFSAVTTTTDEAIPPGTCSSTGGPGDVNNATSVMADPKGAANALYPQSYFCCQTVTTHAEDMSSPATSFASFPTEGTFLMPHQPRNPNVPTTESNVPCAGFASQPQMEHSGAKPPAPPHFSLKKAAPAPVPPLQPSEGTPKGSECFLQFRPFVEQQTGLLETSLGEELLSVATYPCSFGGATGGAQSPSLSMEGAAPHLGGLAADQGPLVGVGHPHNLNPRITPWGLDSPLAFHKPKEEVRPGAAPAKPEELGCGSYIGAPAEEGTLHRQPALPWVVVRPHEEEEKVLTPVSGKAIGCFLQATPAPCKYIQQHAN